MRWWVCLALASLATLGVIGIRFDAEPEPVRLVPESEDLSGIRPKPKELPVRPAPTPEESPVVHEGDHTETP